MEGAPAAASLASTTGVSTPGRRRVQETLLAQLVEAIVAGEFKENATLPNESELTNRYGVSRTVLREAMQFLGAQGMVRSRTRAGTIVLSSENWNFLDPIVLEAALRRRADAPFYAALVEARALLEPEAAALAAERATARQLATIEDAFLAMVDANSRDNEDWSRADLAFHIAIIEASGNWIYRHFASAIRAALLASFRLTNRHTPSHEHMIAVHKAVLDAIRLRKPAKARSAMQALTTMARTELGVVMSRLNAGGRTKSPASTGGGRKHKAAK
jgi:DNA-binding FadR family transcriptional regulator